jgi:hypothetical protein
MGDKNCYQHKKCGPAKKAEVKKINILIKNTDIAERHKNKMHKYIRIPNIW